MLGCLSNLGHNVSIVLRGSIYEKVKCFGNIVVLGALLPQIGHVFLQTGSPQRVLWEPTRVDDVVFGDGKSIQSLLVLQLIKLLIGLGLHIKV